MKNVNAALFPLALLTMLALASLANAGLPSDVFDLAVTSEGPNGDIIRVFPNHVFNVQASDQTLETGVRISWTGAEDLEVYFNVFRDGILLTELSSQDSVFVDTTALPLVTYEYSVELIHYDQQDYHMGYDYGSRGFFRPQQSSGSMYSDTGGVELTWQDRSSIEDGFIIFRDGAPIDSVSVNTTYYFDDTTTPLQVYDYCISAYVTDGTSNYVVNSSNQVSSPYNFDTWDHMVWVSDGFAGLRYFDFSDPINPVYLGSYDNGTEITGYAGNLLIENGQLSHIWMRQMDDPTQVDHWGLVADTFEPHDVVALNLPSHYLLADGSAGVALLVDIEMIAVAERIDTPGTAVGVSHYTVNDSTAYGFVADSGNGLVIVEVIVGEMDWSGGSMSQASTISEATLGGSAVTAAMDGDNLFVTVDGFGIKVFDVSNIGSPVEIGSLSHPSITMPYEISLSATRAYITTGSGLVTLDISDPTYPSFVSNFAHSDAVTAPMLLMGSNAVVATPTALNIIHLPSDVTTARDCTQGVQATLETPTNIQATYGHYVFQTIVSWQDNSSEETGFRVVRNGESFDLGVNATSWADTSDAAGGWVHTYEVYVLDQQGNPLLGGSAEGVFGSLSLRPPTDLVASQLDDYDDRIVLTWTDAPDEDYYDIFREGVLIDSIPAGSTSYESFQDEPNIEVYYTVLSRHNHGGSSANNWVIGMHDDILPPGNVMATDGEYETRVRITWENRSEKTSYYRVLRDGVPIQTITGAGTFTEDTGEQYPLIPGIEYTYDVEAVASAGFASGGNVDTGFRTLLAPTNVSAADALHEDHVLISWTDNSAAETGYNVYRATVADTTLVTTRPIGSTAYLDTTGVSGTTYDYQVEAFDNDGPSERNSDDGLRNLNPPANVSATDGDFEDQVVITWDDESGAETGYTVWRDGSLVGTVGANVTTITDTDETLGTEHEYTVASIDTYGQSETSSDFGVANLLPPGSFTASETNRNEVVLLWTDESALTLGYIIFRDGEAYNFLPSATATSYTDVSAVPGVEYEYCISAYGADAVSSPTVCDVGVRPDIGNWGNNQGWVTNLTASQGDYDNRVRLQWVDNSSIEERFDIYRDEVFVESVEADVEFYNDYEALPGHTHLYRVNAVDEAQPTLFGHDVAVGWILPDGAITGRITTQSGAPVDGVTVSLDPSPNQSLLFDGQHGSAFVENFPIRPGSPYDISIEFWMKSTNTAGSQTVFSYTQADNYDGFHIRTSQSANQVVVVINNTSIPLDSGDLHDGQWHHVAVTASPQNAPRATLLYVDGIQTDQATNTLGPSLPGGNMVLGRELSGPTGDEPNSAYQGLLDEVRVWSSRRTQTEIQENMYQALNGTEYGLVAYYPMDAGSGFGVADMTSSGWNATIGANHFSYNGGVGVFWAGDAAPIELSTVSDIEGNYALSGLRYGGGTTFKVIPSAEDKVFDPAFKSIVLDPQSPVQNEVGFNDITGLSFSGLISYQGTNCVQDAVEIYVDDIFAGNTLANGTFTVSAPPGEHVIEARSGTATFYPENYTINATTNQTGLNFQNTTQHILSGGLGGSCNADIGTLHFRIFTEDGCFETTFEGNTDYSMQLPAREYIVAFESIDIAPGPISEADVVNFFTNMGTQSIDLSNEDATLDMLYRAPLSMSITGFPADCAGFTDPETGNVTAPAPILEQLSSYTLTINVFEDYGTSVCPVDSGTVTIYDEVMDIADTPTVVTVIDGLATYTTTANMPNMAPGRVDAQGNDRSFQKPITFSAEVPGQDPMLQTKWALVTGDRPRTGTFVSCTSEEIPMLILRDPPGDESTSFFEEGKTFTYTMSNSALVDIEAGVEIAIEAGFEFTAGSMFFTTDADAGVETSIGLTIGASATTEGAVVFSVTTTEEFNTAADQVFVGDDADLFLGVAMNLLFAKTDVLSVENCTIQRSEKVRFGADGAEPFETVYLYTASHIENILIPQLENLGELDPDNVAIFNSYAANWNRHLTLNDDLRDLAMENVLENRSFSSGAGYSYTHESSVERSFGWELGLNSELEASTQLGFKVAGTGATTTFSTKMTFESSFGGSESNEATVSTGYTLSDNDPGDYFSVDIGSDPVFGTPVFRNVSGASSCPHEFMTQPRDSIFVAVEPQELHNVPLGTPAEFVLSMVNESVSQEAREYQLRAIQTSNLGGAVIKVNGTLLDDGLSFFLDPGVTQVATLTVEQGPSQFFYNGLQIQAVAPCEYENWENGGTLAAADTVSFLVSFEASCSDVSLVQPTSGWNYNIDDAVANNDTLSFLIDGFQLETSAPDSINSVGAQYRLVDTETWITIDEIQRADIPVYGSNHAQAGEPMSVSIDWALPTLLPDGQYELRAFTSCDNGVGGSIPATGRLDRHSPEVFGSPQPADNSLALGDAISITFNESIDCTSVSGLTVGMAVAGGGQNITTSTTCNGTTVSIAVVTPSLDQLEGEALEVTVSGIKDLAGNTLVGTTTWQFTVTRNGFAWVEAEIYKSAAFQAPGSIVGALVNGSSVDIDFDLTNVPAWLTPVATSGTVIAGQTHEISFAIDPSLTEGSHLATLQAVSVSPSVSAELDVRVDIGCQVPDWEVNPADFEYSMTAVISLEVDSSLSDDPNDIVVGFVGNQVRGIAHPELVNDISPPRYLAFMNIYSNMVAGENVRFQVFDADACHLYNSADNYISFQADERQGFPEGPFELVAMDVAAPDQQAIALNAGWTMFSLSLVDSLDMSVVTILGDLNPSQNDIIKSRTSYAEFDQELGWQGSLSDLDLRESYSINLTDAGQLVHSGVAVDFDTPIYLIDGWNWIGYPQNSGQTVNAGMGDWSPSNGDLFKTQTSFSEYVSSAGSWIGNLIDLAPGVGYKLFVDDAVSSGPLQYAQASSPIAGAGMFTLDPRPEPATLADNKSFGENRPNWEMTVGHEFNMTLTAVVDVDDQRVGIAGGVVGAFAGEELRGYSELVYIPQLNRHIAFLMVHSNQVEGETITLRFYDPQQDAILQVEETLAFGADVTGGTLRDPMVLHANTSDAEARPTIFNLAPAFPNPANQSNGTTISWAMPKGAHVSLTVYDVRGRLVKEMVNDVLLSGHHTHYLNTRQMASGVYFYRLVAGDFTQTRKMMVVK